MSFPYITDIVNAVVGTHWDLPIPTFGIIDRLNGADGALIFGPGEARGELPTSGCT
jgi:hypothetical protein